MTDGLWEQYEEFSARDLSGTEVQYLFCDGIVRHEAPYNRVGWKDPPPACRSRPLKLGAA